MYNGLIIVLTIIAFAFIITSTFTKTKETKMILLGVALIIFGALSVSSASIQMYSCDNFVINSTISGSYDVYNYDRICHTDGFYDEGSMWVFGGFALICAILMLIIGILSFDVADNGTNENNYQGRN